MKVAIVYSFKPSEWFSCTIINENLRAAYEKIYDDILYIDYTRKSEVSEEDFTRIVETGVEEIIFIDHQPTPAGFLYFFKRKYPEAYKKLKYTIHVFGDFPLYMEEWRKVFQNLESRQVRLITASYKQKKFVEKFVQQDDIVEVCPFPVNTNKFYFDSGLRDKTRKELGLKDEYVFLYTGRLTIQKNIVELIEEFTDFHEKNLVPKNSKLYIVGAIDTLGVPYLGITQLQGEYYRSLQKALQKSSVKDQIVLVGKVKNEKLNSYYNMADCFLSLSTYHDEDYGMSVAEAMCSGLPAILTDWAGYSSFQLKTRPEYCQLVATYLTKLKPEFSRDLLKEKVLAHVKSEFLKKDISLVYQKSFSIEACSKILQMISEKKRSEFLGGTDFMKRLTNERILKGVESFKKETTREFNDIYLEAYDVYSG